MRASAVVPRLLADELTRSPIRKIMELADPANLVALGVDPDELISFAGGWVNHQAPAAMREQYRRIATDAETFHACGSYSPTAGLPRLRETLAALEAGVYGTDGLGVDNVIVGQSSTQLAYCLFTALLDAGDTVLLFDPSYANYGPQLAVLDDAVRIATVPVLDTASWSYLDDVDAFVSRLEEALNHHRPKLLLFSSPDNPTGALVPDEAFDETVARAARHDCIVAVDYAYREQFFTAPRPRHFSVDPGRHPNLVAIHSNSKWCRGLGRRLGWAIAAPEIIGTLELVQQAMILCPDTVHQVALAGYLESALADGSLIDYLEDARSRYARAAEHMSSCIRRHLGMRHVEPEGGLYTVIDVGTPADAFVHDVLAATGVVFVPGGGFGDTLAHAVRASFGPLVDDLDRIEEGFLRVRDHLSAGCGR